MHIRAKKLVLKQSTVSCDFEFVLVIAFPKKVPPSSSVSIFTKKSSSAAKLSQCFGLNQNQAKTFWHHLWGSSKKSLFQPLLTKRALIFKHPPIQNYGYPFSHTKQPASQIKSYLHLKISSFTYKSTFFPYKDAYFSINVSLLPIKAPL